MRCTKRLAGSVLAAACTALAAFSGSASAQPDVIVGECYDIQNYGLDAGFRVYAVGTYSCNKATLAGFPKAAPYGAYDNNSLLWIDSSSELPPGAPGTDIKLHPVISQNMYRLKNGRFEQIGQAWLKHGFCALQGNQCSFGCSPGGNCNALYPGCSDPYSGGLNGSQGGLGPKSEVNPHTGNWPYPWVNNGTGTGTTRARRLQVLDTDVDSTNTGALYFVSSIYIQAEDAGANNDNNNQSYRRVDVDTAGTHNITTLYSPASSGPYPTQREKPAIQAWQDHDATVQITTLDIPGDGRYFVACKVTESAGTATYEYAVQNLTANTGASAFSIPLPAGATTNFPADHFHDVPYHSGEVQDSTDWVPTLSAATMAWAVAGGSNNLLRWDTIYNFRFTCNRAPTVGTGTINIGGNRTFSILVPGTGAVGTGNDACANAQVVGAGGISFDTTNATTDGPAECVTASDQGVIGKDVWYLWTNSGTCTGTATIETCGSQFDTKLAVYNAGSCPTVANTNIACNDDACTGGPGGVGNLASRVTFTANAGATYLIRVGGYDADGSGPGVPLSGAGTLTITAPNCAPQAPANDLCANAQILADGVPFTGSTALAGTDGSATCPSQGSNNDVWFKYTPVTSGTFYVNTCGSAFDTVLSAYTGACGALTQVACNDDEGANNPPSGCSGSTFQSRISFAMTANVTYTIRLAGFQTANGNYTIVVGGGGGGAPPANDPCAGRAGISTGSYAFNTTFATTDGVAGLGTCGSATQVHNDLWYNFPVPLTDNGTLRVTTCSAASFDTVIALYNTGVCANVGPGTIIGCSDDACSTQSDVSAHVLAGSSITIRLGGFSSTARGTGTMTVTFTPDPPACVADYDDGSGTGTTDGAVDISDLLYYLALFDAGNLAADIDDGSGTNTPDGGVDISDLLYFLFRFDAGC